MFCGKYDPAKPGFPIKWLAGKVPASDKRNWTSDPRLGKQPDRKARACFAMIKRPCAG